MALSDSFIRNRTSLTPAQKEQLKQEEMKQALLEEAGLEGKDANYLRKQMLSSEEAVEAKQEELDNSRIKKSRKKDWEEFVDEKRRMGHALHHSEILPRLHRLIPNLEVRDGRIKDAISLYIWDRNHPFEDPLLPGGKKVGGVVFLGWLKKGYNPEYEIDIVNDVGIARGQKRGWRTLLLRMICRRHPETFAPTSLFTEEQALAEFGLPSNGETASEYRRQLYEFRNTSPERAKLDHEILQKAQNYTFAPMEF